MQNSRQKSLLETNRTNYVPNPSEKHLVHYKAERIAYNRATGVRSSHPELIMTGVKLFPQVKRDLEKQGYAVEILYHPNGEYNTPMNVPQDADSVSRQTYEETVDANAKALAEKDDEILALKERLEGKRSDESVKLAEKDAEIARLKALLEAKEAEEEAIDLELGDQTEEKKSKKKSKNA